MLHTHIRTTTPARGQPFSVTTLADPRPGRVVIEVAGEIDSCTAPILDACLRAQVDRPALRELVAFMGQVTFLGAAGITVLARADRHCRERGARLVIRSGGRRAVLRPMRLTGLAELVDIDPAHIDRTAPRDPRTGVHPRTSPRRPPVGRPRPVCR